MDKLRTLKRATVAIALGFLLPGQVATRAGMFDGSASATLTITGITHAGGGAGVTLLGFADVPILQEATTGAATASATGSSSVLAADPLDMGVGDGLTASAMTMGTASLPVGSFADGFAGMGGLITIDNASALPVTVDFDVTYSMSVDSSVSQPLAEADVFADVVAFSLFGGVDFVFEFIFSTSTGDSSDGLVTMGATSSHSLVVPGMSDEELDLSLDVFGSASSPEPSTGATLLALGVLGGLRRRRET